MSSAADRTITDPVITVFCAERRLVFAGRSFCCAIGRSGAVRAGEKQEGDGATPLGKYPLRLVYYRPDRIEALKSRLEVRALTKDTGWCDAPKDPNYNRPVTYPYHASAEHLWRDDGRYDLIVILGYNDAPVRPGLGSAIFLHCAETDSRGTFCPTEGCIALAREDLLGMIPHFTSRVIMGIEA